MKKAEQIGAKMNIAVVDAGAISRRSHGWTGRGSARSTSSIRKARTARFFDMNTGQIGQLSQPGGSLFGIEHWVQISFRMAL